jgi:hypothetical protein
MPVPQAVIEMEQRANALIQSMNEGGAQPPTPAPAPPAQAPVAAPAAPQPQPTPQSQPPASAPAADTWEHRYSVLQGKYNAEVPKLVGQVSELTRKVDELTRLNAGLSEQLKNAPVQPLVRPEDVEEHGESMVDLIRRAAREELQAATSKIDELSRELDAIKGPAQKATQQSFLTKLGELVPDWGQINDDASFHRWLLEPDELSGEIRQTLLDRAHGALDGDRAAKIFTAFKRARETWAASATDALSQQVVPNTGSAGAPPTQSVQGKVWTRAEINDFYTKVRTGQLKGPEAAAIETDIQQAMIQGRIQ